MWLPLSQAGIDTYAHSSQLANKEPCYFVPTLQWGTVFKVELFGFISKSEMADRFGEEVSRRARDDYPAVVVQLSKA